jgi:hypothetical protein
MDPCSICQHDRRDHEGQHCNLCHIFNSDPLRASDGIGNKQGCLHWFKREPR